MFEILNFPGIELVGFILILGAAIIIEKITMNTTNKELDFLVDEMEWEDSDKIDFISLEAAGLENLDYDTVPTIQRDNYYNQEN